MYSSAFEHTNNMKYENKQVVTFPLSPSFSLSHTHTYTFYVLRQLYEKQVIYF